MDEPIRTRAHVYISGQVHGVWFRESTRRCAAELDLLGFVRNLPDGRVEAVFEGSAEAVEAAIEFVRHGPPLARVSGVEVEMEPPSEIGIAPDAFQIS